MANMFTFKIDTENSELTNKGTDIKITNWCGTSTPPKIGRVEIKVTNYGQKTLQNVHRAKHNTIYNLIQIYKTVTS